MANTITKHENLIMKIPMKELIQNKSEIASSGKEDALEIFNSTPIPNEKGEDCLYTEFEKLKL